MGCVGAGEACGSSTHPTCIPPFLLISLSRWFGVVVGLFIASVLAGSFFTNDAFLFSFFVELYGKFLFA